MKKNYSDKELLDRRLAGVLPTIEVAGSNYIIDWRLRELRAEDDPNCTIRLGQMAMDRTGENYLCFYHLPTRSVVNISQDITVMPKDVVMLEIPNELKLDPIGTAREYGLEDTFLLDKYPIRPELKARVIAVEESGLAELIKSNIAKKQQGKKIKPKVKKRKGL